MVHSRDTESPLMPQRPVSLEAVSLLESSKEKPLGCSFHGKWTSDAARMRYW